MSSKALPDAGAVVKLVTSLIGKQVTQKPGVALKQVPKGELSVCSGMTHRRSLYSLWPTYPWPRQAAPPWP